jgi:hypothetical protein
MITKVRRNVQLSSSFGPQCHNGRRWILVDKSDGQLLTRMKISFQERKKRIHKWPQFWRFSEKAEFGATNVKKAKPRRSKMISMLVNSLVDEASLETGQRGRRQPQRGRHWPPYGHKLIFITKNGHYYRGQPGDHLGLQVKKQDWLCWIFKVTAKIWKKFSKCLKTILFKCFLKWFKINLK